MYLYHNIDNELIMNVEHNYRRQHLIETLKKRFTTYGYDEISTSTFEHYDLYASMNGTVNHHEMIKTIDNTGQVLVLRPDITIPLTQKIANNDQKLHEHLRYFYVLDVFRQASDSKDFLESTQAGVEYFGNESANADAEIIALAIHVLQDFEFENFKIELGHAGFFKQLVAKLDLNKQDINELKEFIQAKNVPEIQQFMTRLNVDKDVSQIVSSLPFLYGNPMEVIKRAKELPLDGKMKETLQNMENIFDILQSYGVLKHVVIDLSLINHMDYYSDLIFQGFIKKIGKPILMGGRYNTLANQFEANIPAIGFAFDIESLLAGIEPTLLPKRKQIDVQLYYEKTAEQRALRFATLLREQNYTVLTHDTHPENTRQGKFTVKVESSKNTFTYNEEVQSFSDEKELIQLLELFRERE